MLEILQEVQLLVPREQVAQVDEQEVHVPLMGIMLASGQLDTHPPLASTSSAEHDVHDVALTAHVVHEAEHGSQVWLVELAIVYEAGQLVKHALLYRK